MARPCIRKSVSHCVSVHTIKREIVQHLYSRFPWFYKNVKQFEPGIHIDLGEIRDSSCSWRVIDPSMQFTADWPESGEKERARFFWSLIYSDHQSSSRVPENISNASIKLSEATVSIKNINALLFNLRVFNAMSRLL